MLRSILGLLEQQNITITSLVFQVEKSCHIALIYQNNEMINNKTPLFKFKNFLFMLNVQLCTHGDLKKSSVKRTSVSYSTGCCDLTRTCLVLSIHDTSTSAECTHQ